VLLEQLAQTSSGLIAVQSPRCDIENEGFPVIGEQFRPRQQIIALEENQTGGERGPFISVDEGVISAKTKKVRSGDFYRIGHERLPIIDACGAATVDSNNDDAIHRQACALLEIFDGLFRCRVEGAGDVPRRGHLGRYKDTLKFSYGVTSRTDAECQAAIHNFVATCSGRLSQPYLREKQSAIQVSLHGLAAAAREWSRELARDIERVAIGNCAGRRQRS